MKMLAVSFITLCIIELSAGTPSCALPETNPVTLLNEVAQNYARAKTYHIEATQERVTTNSRFYEWDKTDLVAIQGTKGRFRFEMKIGATGGSWLQISDGRTEWFYAKHWNRYIQRAASPDGPDAMVRIFGFGGELGQARSLIRDLEHLAAPEDSNLMLQDQTVDLNGKKFSCYVVHVSRQGSDRTDKAPYEFERTLWIDKRNKVIRKVVETSAAYIPGSPIRYPTSSTAETNIYPVVELNGKNSASEFSFTPPPNAKRVSTLDPPRPTTRVHPAHPAALLNKPAPPIKFLTKDGIKISLADYKGKPVLLDFWATWCGPCLESMPQLARMNQQFRRTPVAVISIDEDADAKVGEEFFARHEYDWKNFHDDKRAIQKAFEGKAIPLTILIDQNGKITYYSNGWDGSGVRTAISKLGPEYAATFHR